LAKAESYYHDNITNEDHLLFRQLGVIEFYRNRRPETTKTDDEILEWFDKVSSKYEGETND